ncbi:MAG: peptidyl-prolyl cis-trans isomerase [Betaproteobacteria bacterium]|nr:peptidyl-prolyl cis-trans isomerase [Betaproteobacteria bacterium]
MNKLLRVPLAALGLALALVAHAAGAAPVKVLIKTSMGDIHAELEPDKAPVTVKNFLDYVKAGHYNGTIFHRVINGFMIQGGGYTPTFSEKPVRPPIKLESNNGLSNLRGTLAMARTNAPDSASSQFFINVVDNHFLDYRKFDEQTTVSTPRGERVIPAGTVNNGYAVFGKVTQGMDVVDKIKAVPTTSKGMMQNVPVEPVVIESISIEK